MDDNIKVIEWTWFGAGDNVIGIVIIEDKITNKRKAYIGACSGLEEQEDIEMIVKYGTPVYAIALTRVLKKLTGKQWIEVQE